MGRGFLLGLGMSVLVLFLYYQNACTDITPWAHMLGQLTGHSIPSHVVICGLP